MKETNLNRRGFLEAAAVLSSAAPLVLSAQPRAIPLGIQAFSVRTEFQKDQMATIRRVGEMGYSVIEYYGPYYNWTAEQAKAVRKVQDDVSLRCLSTHNAPAAFDPANIQKTIDLHQTLGARYVLLAAAGRLNTLDDAKKVAEILSTASEKLAPAGLCAGIHNNTDFQMMGDQRPAQLIAANTPSSVVLEICTGGCMAAGLDPIAWINANPGRVRLIHMKDWSREKGYGMLLGEGDTPWEQLYRAAESTAGTEAYLIDQDRSAFAEFEMAERSLANFRRLHTGTR